MDINQYSYDHNQQYDNYNYNQSQQEDHAINEIDQFLNDDEF